MAALEDADKDLSYLMEAYSAKNVFPPILLPTGPLEATPGKSKHSLSIVKLLCNGRVDDVHEITYFPTLIVLLLSLYYYK